MWCQPIGKSKRFGSQGYRWRAGVWNSFLNSPKAGPKVYNTADSMVGTQPGTDVALQDLISLIGREPVLFLWCGRRRKLQAKSCSMARTLR